MGWTSVSPFLWSSQTAPCARTRKTSAARTAVRESHGITRGRTRYGWRTKELAVKGVRADDGELWSDEQHVHRLPSGLSGFRDQIMSLSRAGVKLQAEITFLLNVEL